MAAHKPLYRSLYFQVIVAIVIYIIQAARNRAAGVDLAMLYREIPPD